MRNPEIDAYPMGGDVFTSSILFGEQLQPIEILLDTGSSWTWVNSCNPDANYWKQHECPSFFFDQTKSSSISYSGEEKYIKYGIGSMTGDIVSDFMGVADDVKVKMPFLLNNVDFEFMP